MTVIINNHVQFITNLNLCLHMCELTLLMWILLKLSSD